jgi:hypothetical protein
LIMVFSAGVGPDSPSCIVSPIRMRLASQSIG